MRVNDYGQKRRAPSASCARVRCSDQECARVRHKFGTKPAAARRSAAELTHDRLPRRIRLAVARIVARLLAHGGVHHDEPALRIDEDRLAAHAEEREHPPLAREEPGLVAVAQIGRRDAGPEVRLAGLLGRGVVDACGRDELATAPVPVARQQQAEPRIVPQDGVEATVGRLLAGRVDQPRRVGLGANR